MTLDTLKSIWQVVYLTIVVVLVGFSFLVVSTRLPLPGNWQLLTVTSGSMEPKIPVGSMVLVKPSQTLQTGDVITFDPNPNLTVTHRIVAVEYEQTNKRFLTKGDANDDLDTWKVAPEQVRGKVILTLPFLGYLSQWLKSPTGFVVAIVLPSAVIIYAELMVLKKQTLDWLRKRGHLRLAAVLLLLAFSFAPATQALFLDKETSANNQINVSLHYNRPVLNELVAVPSVQFGQEWVELYNPASDPVDLTGWQIEVDGQMFDLTSLGSLPGQSWTVWSVAGDNLPDSGSQVKLWDAGNQLIDAVTYPSLADDQSWGRINDASLPWQACTNPSQNSSNQTACP